MRAIVMGTKQKFQNHGIESALFITLGEYVLPLNQYTELELSWVGDFNEKDDSNAQCNGGGIWKEALNDAANYTFLNTNYHEFYRITRIGVSLTKTLQGYL